MKALKKKCNETKIKLNAAAISDVDVTSLLNDLKDKQRILNELSQDASALHKVRDN